MKVYRSFAILFLFIGLMVFAGTTLADKIENRTKQNPHNPAFYLPETRPSAEFTSNASSNAHAKGIEIESIIYNYRGQAYPLKRIMEGEFAIELYCGDNAGGVDIVFCIDNTGSMGGTINGVRDNISELVGMLDAGEYNYRLGGVCYGDAVAPDIEPWDGTPRELFDADGNLATGWQMTSDFTQFNTWLMTITAWGGGDGAENSLCAIMAAANNYDWRENAIHIIVFFTDNTFYERGDGCDGVCDYTRAEGYSVIVDGGYILFSSTSTISWDDFCTAMNDPVDATFWYQNTTTSSGGNWYPLGVTWDIIFNDVIALVDTFEIISFCVTNNTGAYLSELTAEIIPGSCISVSSENPQTYGPWSIGERHCYMWQINSVEGCIGQEACFDLVVSSLGFSDTARGCIFIPDCGCPGPTAEPICPPYAAISACPYQDITIRINDEGSGVQASKIRLEVDGHEYIYPDNMTFDDGVVRFIPDEIWAHNRVIVYNLVDAEDSMGCDLREEVSGAFITDLRPPEVTSFNPPCGFQFGDSIEFSWHIEDFPGTINVSSIVLHIDGAEFRHGDGHLNYHITGIYGDGDLIFRANSFAIGIMPGDTFTACVYIADGVLPGLDSCSLCGPNDTTICCEYSISPCVGPVAQVVCPPSSTPTDTTITACPYQSIVIELIGEDNPINESTIRIQIAGTNFACVDAELTYADDTLVFIPQNPWAHGQIVPFNLYRADDTRGCTITAPASSFFAVDLEPPLVQNVQPQPGFEFTGIMTISVWLEDRPAGIDYNNITMTIDGTEYRMGDGFLSYAGGNTEGVATISGLPDDFGIARGDTFEVCITANDLIPANEGPCELCGPNDTTYCFEYMFYPLTTCERLPNPFTPNGDGINDYAQFYYPEMYRLDGVISIFTIRNIKVKEIEVKRGAGAVEMARWDGTDFAGNPLPMGLYIYVIKTENEVVCNGTVTLAK